MNIPIKTKIGTFYKALLTLMNKFPPIRGLRPRELEVLAEIMLQNYENRAIEDFTKRQRFIFSTANRQEMRERLNLSEGAFNNYIKNLKKHGVITKDNTLLRFLDIIPYNKYEFKIDFTIV